MFTDYPKGMGRVGGACRNLGLTEGSLPCPQLKGQRRGRCTDPNRQESPTGDLEGRGAVSAGQQLALGDLEGSQENECFRLLPAPSDLRGMDRASHSPRPVRSQRAQAPWLVSQEASTVEKGDRVTDRSKRKVSSTCA